MALTSSTVRRRPRGARLALLGALPLLVALAACGTSSGEKPAASAVAESGGASSGPAADVATATVALEAKVAKLDPNATTQVVALQVLHLIAGTLTEDTGKGGVQPGLAQKWSTAADGLSATFTLAPKLTFSDGTPLTAADVAASWAYFLGDKANVNAGQIAPIKDVVATGDRTVVFHLKSTFPSLATITSRPSYMIMPKTRIAQSGFMTKPVSAGPYQLQSWDGGNTLTITRNDRYSGAKPAVKTIKFVTISDAAARLSQLQSGQIQYATNLPPTVSKQVSSPISVQSAPVYGGTYIYVNDRRGPLSEVGVRQAVSRAIDRAQISKITFGGAAKPMDDFFPSTMSSHKSSFPTDRDVAAAKKLLAGTRCASGCTINMLMRSATTQAIQQLGVIVQQELAAIGIKIKISQVDDSVWADALNGSFEMTIDTLSDTADAPDAMLNLGVISDGGVQALFSGYKSATMDKAARDAIAFSGSQREAALDTVHKTFATDMPFIPVMDLVYVSATNLPKGTIYQSPSSFFDVARSS